MIRNRLLPTYIFAILMAGVAVFALVVGWVMHLEVESQLNYGAPSTESIAFRNGFALAGIAVIALSIGLMMRQKWAFWGFLSFLWLAVIAWTGLGYMLLTHSDSAAFKPLLGLSLVIYSALFAGILTLSNARVLALFHDHSTSKLFEDMADDVSDPS